MSLVIIEHTMKVEDMNGLKEEITKAWLIEALAKTKGVETIINERGEILFKITKNSYVDTKSIVRLLTFFNMSNMDTTTLSNILPDFVKLVRELKICICHNHDTAEWFLMNHANKGNIYGMLRLSDTTPGYLTFTWLTFDKELEKHVPNHYRIKILTEDDGVIRVANIEKDVLAKIESIPNVHYCLSNHSPKMVYTPFSDIDMVNTNFINFLIEHATKDTTDGIRAVNLVDGGVVFELPGGHLVTADTIRSYVIFFDLPGITKENLYKLIPDVLTMLKNWDIFPNDDINMSHLRVLTNRCPGVDGELRFSKTRYGHIVKVQREADTTWHTRIKVIEKSNNSYYLVDVANAINEAVGEVRPQDIIGYR